MTSYITVTLAAARNDELQRRAALPAPLSALDGIRSSRRAKAVMRSFRRRARQAQAQPLPHRGFTPRGA